MHTLDASFYQAPRVTISAVDLKQIYIIRKRKTEEQGGLTRRTFFKSGTPNAAFKDYETSKRKTKMDTKHYCLCRYCRFLYPFFILGSRHPFEKAYNFGSTPCLHLKRSLARSLFPVLLQSLCLWKGRAIAVLAVVESNIKKVRFFIFSSFLFTCRFVGIPSLHLWCCACFLFIVRSFLLQVCDRFNLVLGCVDHYSRTLLQRQNFLQTFKNLIWENE